MFFFYYGEASETNCAPEFSNQHVYGEGFNGPDAYYNNGYYNGFTNQAYWETELTDARWAGLDFVAPNDYGDQIAAGQNVAGLINNALSAIGGGIKIGYFDDTSGYSRYSVQPPSLSDTEGAASYIFEGKWQQWFDNLSRDNWYMYNSKPYIQMYNAGLLLSYDAMSAVLARLKQKFSDMYGVEPFVNLDVAWPGDGNEDAVFTWYSYGTSPSQTNTNGVSAGHFFARQDRVQRDANTATAIAHGSSDANGNPIVKDGSWLQSGLDQTSGDSIVTMATWNDIGEGTGIGRQYDIWFNGAWQTPDTFIRQIRTSQCTN